MAEFKEVMRQAKRMCRSFGEACDGCKLHWFDGETLCLLSGTPETWHDSEMPDAERIVMDWAAENPETRYPTWKEWQDTNFPNNDALMRPCIFESEEYFECKLEIDCEKCMNKPIPADIAEKLGIKPIRGGGDA